jgi:excisionase family DNA binding protein
LEDGIHNNPDQMQLLRSSPDLAGNAADVTIRRDVHADHGTPWTSSPGKVEELLMHNRTTRTTPRPFVSVEEAALLLGEARSTVYRSVKAGTFPLPVVRIGARIRIPVLLLIDSSPARIPRTPTKTCASQRVDGSIWSC